MLADRRSFALATLVALALATALPAPAQDEEPPLEAPPEEQPERVAPPSGMALLETDSGAVALPIAYAPTGPLFALKTIADQLQLDLRVGPLAASHVLHLHDRRALVGPDSPLVVITFEGGRQELLELSTAPLRTGEGLKVPLDFLERTIGDSLSYDFSWDGPRQRLRAGRRQQRELLGSLWRIHQGRITTVQISFSELPRYRIERRPGVVDVRLIGDRLTLERNDVGVSDPLVESVLPIPEGLRVLLAPGAEAAEPRLLDDPPRLIIEVFQRAEEVAEETPSPPPPRPSAKRAAGLRTIVIDPGHGGVETGAVGRDGTVEKDLTLWFARTLRQRLRERLSRVRVLLTREDDVELPLDSRTAFANQNQADLFISLHLNSWFGPNAKGAETYFLSRQASDERAAEAAAAENRGAGGGDAELDLELILWDLAQSYHLAESQRFASIVQEELNASLDMGNRGVKQAPFRVLMGANMPAVVVELGFLSNPQEARRLQSPEYRGELVEALSRAVVRFRAQLEAREDTDETSP